MFLCCSCTYEKRFICERALSLPSCIRGLHVCVFQVLRLAANRLSSVPLMALHSLTLLRTLDLSDNPLVVLHRNTLASAKHLVSLNVSGTRLGRLEPGTTRHASGTLSVLDISRCGLMTAAPHAGDIAALTRLHRLTLPARTCRCDVINFRSVVDDMRSRQRPRPSLFCGDAAVDIDAICSDRLSPTASAKPAVANRPRNQRHDGSDDPLPYNPMLGWYTAAVLSGLLFSFIACVGLEKAEKHLLDWCTSRHSNQKPLEPLDQRWQSSHQQQQQQQRQQHPTTTASVCTVADFGVGVDSSLDAETTTT